MLLQRRSPGIEPAGGESHVHLRLEGSDQLIVVQVPGRPDLGDGTTVAAQLRVAAFHPFNRESGRRTG